MILQREIRINFRQISCNFFYVLEFVSNLTNMIMTVIGVLMKLQNISSNAYNIFVRTVYDYSFNIFASLCIFLILMKRCVYIRANNIERSMANAYKRHAWVRRFQSVRDLSFYTIERSRSRFEPVTRLSTMGTRLN